MAAYWSVSAVIAETGLKYLCN